MLEPSAFEPGEAGGGEWFWQYEDARLYVERGEPVRLRVRAARPRPAPLCAPEPNHYCFLASMLP